MRSACLALSAAIFLRLISAGSGAEAKAPVTVRTNNVFSEFKLQAGEKQAIKFAASRPPAGKEAVLSLKARLDTPKAAGFTQALKVTLNGRVLDGSHLVDKPRQGTAASGRVYSLVAVDRFATFYAPDFTSADKSQYGMAGVKSCEFKLRVTDLLRDGENELVIANAADSRVKAPLIVAEGTLSTGEAAVMQVAKPKAGPPTGPLPSITPDPDAKVGYAAKELPDLKLEVELAGEKFAVESEFSTPDGKWARGPSQFFRHSRTVERQAEAIIVRDSFTNLAKENLPLMQQHRARAASGMKKIWLAGLSPSSLSGTASEPANPTSYGMTAKAGLGLLPLNDEFQTHVANQAADGMLSLADRQFVLRPGASYTAEWAIVLTKRPDYFDFVNAVRRLRDSNFTIKDCFAFLRAAPQTEKWTDKEFGDFVRFKSANLVCASIVHPRHRGVYPHGTAFQLVAHDNFQRYTERVRRLLPGVRSSVYFHCYIDVAEDSPEKFADARVLRANGAQADYGEAVYKIFFPTAENAYGKAVARNVDVILDEIHADGVYWDEMEYSAYEYHFGEPWDGCSADIDAATHKIRRLKSSVTLITQPWRVALAKKILQRGPLIANGQPHTRTMAALKFPRFVETGSPSHCALAQLHSPIALGDHLTEKSELDAYRMMLTALDYGCLYHWYNDMNVIPTHPTLTQSMYPITPLELHQGYVIGRERIITKRSGLFGWGDKSRHEVRVFDEQGREVSGFKAPTVERNGQTFSEIRIGEDWSAAIVRQ